jgi:hypothetical protein
VALSERGQNQFSRGAANKMSEVAGRDRLADEPAAAAQAVLHLRPGMAGDDAGAAAAVPYDQSKPIGVAFWATVDDEVEQRLAAGTTKMRPQDWKSGDCLWVVEVIAPFGGAEEMVKDLKPKVFRSGRRSFSR